ncbi:MaoC family dehydratase [Microbulbifer sp. S227A]|uniref:MaoC family dehydratase n=1 Tax=Microbulbifer sp. S227A TaxID=3415131 RepID=UPI003C7B65CC
MQLTELTAHVGKEIALSDWMAIEQTRIDAFADCANDHQWLHTDPERAKAESPFGTTIAHGFLTLSLLTELQRDAGAWPQDVTSTVNYGLDGVRFISPVPAGARIRNRTVCASVAQKKDNAWLVKLENTLEVEGQAKPALVATSLLMMFT